MDSDSDFGSKLNDSGFESMVSSTRFPALVICYKAVLSVNTSFRFLFDLLPFDNSSVIIGSQS